jgi:hypothetical protein
MLDVLNEFQNAALAFNTVTLVVPSVLGVLLGIVLWLGGAKFTRIIASAAGLIGGATGAFYLFPEHQNTAAISGAVAGALVAIPIHKFFAIIAGLAILVIAITTMLVGIHFSDKLSDASYKYRPGGISAKMTQEETLQQVKLRLANVSRRLYGLAARLPLNTWSVFGAAVGAAALAALFFRRFAVALACSSVGTGLIFAGMFGLLMYKGAGPLTHTYERITFFFAVFAVMVAAGAVSQMILCRPPKLKMLKEEKEDKKVTLGEHKWTYPQS